MKKILKAIIMILIGLTMVAVGIWFFRTNANVLRWIGIIGAILGVVLTLCGAWSAAECWEHRAKPATPATEPTTAPVTTAAAPTEVPATSRVVAEEIKSFRKLRVAEDDVADGLLEAEEVLEAAEAYEDAVAAKAKELDRKLRKARARRLADPED